MPVWSTATRTTRAQRRPESEPRRHDPPIRFSNVAGTPAQRRPESEPRRHSVPSTHSFSRGRPAQRRPESEPRRHSTCQQPKVVRFCSLNEGRSLNPGDTARDENPHRLGLHAQRRPESEPRRHIEDAELELVALTDAQRRPESEPRRHPTSSPSSPARGNALNEGRSLNPGDTPGSLAPARRRVLGRSTKAGV